MSEKKITRGQFIKRLFVAGAGASLIGSLFVTPNRDSDKGGYGNRPYGI